MKKILYKFQDRNSNKSKKFAGSIMIDVRDLGIEVAKRLVRQNVSGSYEVSNVVIEDIK